MRVVRRGLRRRHALEIPDRDGAVWVVDEEAHPRMAETVRVLGRYFDEFELWRGQRLQVERLTAQELAEWIAAAGVDGNVVFHVERDPPPPRRPEPDVAGVEAVERAWERVERWLDAHHPAEQRVLAPGASEEAIAAAEQRVGHAFPEPFRASLRRHDGAGFVSEGHELLSAELIAEEWESMLELHAEYGDEWWRRTWIPFSSDGSGQHLCIDVETGGVVEFIHDDENDLDAARRFEGWLTRWAEELEAGEQVYDVETGTVDFPTS